ncbi:MAG: AAA family ATPase [Eubacterium sp.]|nr:AAA family ATPase [Eubacterium sp.]
MPENNENVTIKYYSEVKSTKVHWLWNPYIPYGKITLIQGDPGEGKSSFILKVAAELSVGGFIPDGTISRRPMNIIYQCMEDSAADTIMPRLENYGADLSRMAFIMKENDMYSDFDTDSLLYAIKESSARLLIIDPIQSFLGSDTDMNNARNVRSYLNKLAIVAEKTKCAVVLIGHLNKNEGGKSIYRGLGSIDFAAISRSVLQIERLGEDSNVRVIRHIKSSLSQEGGAFGFEITENNNINWIGTIDVEEEKGSIIQQSYISYGEKYKSAILLLKKLLSESDCSYKKIVKSVKGLISLRTLKTAKKDLGIISIKKADGWYWHLPEENELSDE